MVRVGDVIIVDSAERTERVDGRTDHPFGPDAQGQLVYAADVYLSGQMMSADRSHGHGPKRSNSRPAKRTRSSRRSTRSSATPVTGNATRVRSRTTVRRLASVDQAGSYVAPTARES